MSLIGGAAAIDASRRFVSSTRATARTLISFLILNCHRIELACIPGYPRLTLIGAAMVPVFEKPSIRIGTPVS
jgi:hypothetical protein